jgi:hypothetical protein
MVHGTHDADQVQSTMIKRRSRWAVLRLSRIWRSVKATKMGMTSHEKGPGEVEPPEPFGNSASLGVRGVAGFHPYAALGRMHVGLYWAAGNG